MRGDNILRAIPISGQSFRRQTKRGREQGRGSRRRPAMVTVMAMVTMMAMVTVVSVMAMMPMVSVMSVDRHCRFPFPSR
jgi:hypothetical protein